MSPLVDYAALVREELQPRLDEYLPCCNIGGRPKPYTRYIIRAATGFERMG